MLVKGLNFTFQSQKILVAFFKRLMCLNFKCKSEFLEQHLVLMKRDTLLRFHGSARFLKLDEI